MGMPSECRAHFCQRVKFRGNVALLVASHEDKGSAKVRQPDGTRKVPSLSDLLWKALLLVQATKELQPDDPIFLEFRHNVLRIIADLELLRSRQDPDEAKCAQISFFEQ